MLPKDCPSLIIISYFKRRCCRSKRKSDSVGLRNGTSIYIHGGLIMNVFERHVKSRIRLVIGPIFARANNIDLIFGRLSPKLI